MTAECLLELVVSLVVTSDRILRGRVRTNLKLELKFAVGLVGQCRSAIRLRWAKEIVPKRSTNSVGISLVEGQEGRFQTREGTRRVDTVFYQSRWSGRLKLGDECVIGDR